LPINSEMGERAKAHVLAGGMSTLLSGLVLMFAGLAVVGGIAGAGATSTSGADSVTLSPAGSAQPALIRERGFGATSASRATSDRAGKRHSGNASHRTADGRGRSCLDCDTSTTDQSDSLVEAGVSIHVGPIDEQLSVKAGSSSGDTRTTTVEVAGVKVTVKTSKDAVADTVESAIDGLGCLSAC
jgi:hypothetical protein